MSHPFRESNARKQQIILTSGSRTRSDHEEPRQFVPMPIRYRRCCRRFRFEQIHKRKPRLLRCVRVLMERAMIVGSGCRKRPLIEADPEQGCDRMLFPVVKSLFGLIMPVAIPKTGMRNRKNKLPFVLDHAPYCNNPQCLGAFPVIISCAQNPVDQVVLP